MTLQTYYEDGNVYSGNSVNWVNGIIANAVAYTYNVDGTVDEIEETVDGSTITTAFTYNGDGTVNTIVETRDSKTVTTTYTYSSGVVTDTVRTVV